MEFDHRPMAATEYQSSQIPASGYGAIDVDDSADALKSSKRPGYSPMSASEYALFNWLYALTQLLALASILLVGVWMGYFGGGLDWRQNRKLESRWHPLLTSLGLMLINGEAILVYRGFRNTSKRVTKAIHAGIQLIAFVVVLAGIKSIYDTKAEGKLHWASGHSWIGLLALSLFALQFITAFMIFYKPGAPMEMRKAAMPVHRILGVIIFVMCLSATLMGLAERVAFKLTCWFRDNTICAELWLANLFGLCVLLYAAMVIWLVTHAGWIRKPLPSDSPNAPNASPAVLIRRHRVRYEVGEEAGAFHSTQPYQRLE